ncbi:MAG: hypothetical protein JKX72_04650 [Robiginitomaculum sp.]|nr:hypothetical protein [Robiginitomaculum sp.]
MALSGLKMFIGFALSLSLLGAGGCAQLQDYSGSLWQRSQSLGNAFVSLLRPAPQQKEQFFASVPETIIPEAVEIKTYAENRVFSGGLLLQYEYLSVFPRLKNDIFEIEESELDTIPVIVADLPEVSLLPTPQVKPKTKKKVETKKKEKVKPITITLPIMDDIEMLAGEPMSGRKLAFVNKKGRTDIKDLNICAKQAGKTYIESFMGYDINPEFLTCLNDKGYVSVTSIEA